MMRFSVRRRSLVAVLLLLPMGELVAQDTITLQRRDRRSSKVLGTIQEVSPTQVVISTAAGNRTIAVNEILRVNLAGEPAALRQARTAALSGQYEQALQQLEDLQLDPNAQDLLRQEVEYYRAEAAANLALQGNGDANTAVRQLLEFVRTNRESMHFFGAVRLLGDLAVALGSYDHASRYYQQLGKAPWPESKLLATVLEGQSLRGQGAYQEAIDKFDEALTTRLSDAEAIRQQTLAQIGKASCLAELEKTDEAQKIIEDVLAKNDPTDDELFAQAYLALGTVHRRANRPLDAVLAYLHIDLLFFRQRDAHAEALYYLSNLWGQIDKPERAVQTRNLLKSRYGGTIWGKRDTG